MSTICNTKEFHKVLFFLTCVLVTLVLYNHIKQREETGKDSTSGKTNNERIPDTTNKTVLYRALNAEKIIYNRVSKCGSETLLNLIKTLAVQNSFNFIHSHITNKRHISQEEQEKLVRELDEAQTPYLYDRHIHMLDFTKYNKQQPLYINLIRDPIGRFISAYYYQWQPRRSNSTHSMDIRTRNLTIDECIKQNLPTCVDPFSSGNLWNIVPYFCGHHQICRKPSVEALHLAKLNVNKYFAVVGVLDRFDDFLCVLENVIPRYFWGSNRMYSAMKKKRNRTQNPLKEELSTFGWKFLRGKMEYEYDFYHFIQDRFSRLFADVSMTC